jgi:hypothetical protein
MKSLTLTPQLAEVARRVVWFEPPEQAIADPVRFLAYAMTYGSHNDMVVIREQLSDNDLREAIAQAPPGIFDPRSWSYWHLKLGRYPAPPMPTRSLRYSPDHDHRCGFTERV